MDSFSFFGTRYLSLLRVLVTLPQYPMHSYVLVLFCFHLSLCFGPLKRSLRPWVIQHPLFCSEIPIVIIIIVQRQAADGLCLRMLHVEMFSFSSHTTCHIKKGMFIACWCFICQASRREVTSDICQYKTLIKWCQWKINIGCSACKVQGSVPREYIAFDIFTTRCNITYLLTPWSRVLLEKLTSKLCS